MSTNENKAAAEITDKIMTSPLPLPPFCINCKHYLPGQDGNDGTDMTKDKPRCGKAKFLDVVSGKDFQAYCADFRNPEAPCGTEARFFEAK